MFEEMADFCTQCYWAVFPYSVVREWVNLQASPLGAVPQRDRRPRLIVDYSFSEVNNETVPLAPSEAMQLGRALQHVLARVVHADQRYGHVHLAKIDIVDGFYRVWLQIRRCVAYHTRTTCSHCFSSQTSNGLGGIPSLLYRPHRDGLRPGKPASAHSPATSGHAARHTDSTRRWQQHRLWRPGNPGRPTDGVPSPTGFPRRSS